jgi:hypothetical protein
MATTIKKVASDFKSCKGGFDKAERNDVRVECGLDIV